MNWLSIQFWVSWSGAVMSAIIATLLGPSAYGWMLIPAYLCLLYSFIIIFIRGKKI